MAQKAPGCGRHIWGTVRMVLLLPALGGFCGVGGAPLELQGALPALGGAVLSQALPRSQNADRKLPTAFSGHDMLRSRSHSAVVALADASVVAKGEDSGLLFEL